MKKPGQQTYLNEDEESLVIASTDIEVFHGLPLDCRGVAQQFQNVVGDVNYRCGDNGILEKYSMGYFRELIKRVNKREDEHEYQKNNYCTGLVKVSRLSNTRAS